MNTYNNKSNLNLYSNMINYLIWIKELHQLKQMLLKKILLINLKD